MDMISQGYHDVDIKLNNGEIIHSVKSILCYSNKKFRSVLEDTDFENPLSVNEDINKESLVLLFQYYGGGKIEINNENVKNLMLLCLYYSENDLLIQLKNYCINHLNEDIIKYLLNNIEIMNFGLIKNLKIKCDSYIRESGYILLEDSSQLKIDGIKYILSTDNLPIKNENQILNFLISYFKENKNEIENNEEKKYSFYGLMKYVNWDIINVKTIKSEDLSLVDKFEDSLDSALEITIHRNYSLFPNIKNQKLDRIMNKVYNSIILHEEQEQNYYGNNINIGNEDVNEDLKMLLLSNDIRIIKATIYVMIDNSIDYEIENDLKSKLLKDLIRDYKELKSKEDERAITVKCISYFVNYESLKKIYDKCGYNILMKLLNLNTISIERSETIAKFIKDVGLLNNEKVLHRFKSNVKKSDIKRKITKKMTYFRYEKNKYVFHVNEEVYIPCETDGEGCHFSIYPILPSGLDIDEKTGEIGGKPLKTSERKTYEVTCKNSDCEMKFSITLSITTYQFLPNKNSGVGGLSIINEGKKLLCVGNKGCCFINLKLVNRIYRIKYKVSFKFTAYFNIGVSTKMDSSTKNDQTYSLDLYNSESRLFGNNKVRNPHYITNKGDEYEFIYKMDKMSISVKQNGGEEIEIFKDLPSPLYPFVTLTEKGSGIEILSILIE